MPDDAMTDDQLRHWAEHNQSHSAAARGVLRLLAEVEQWMPRAPIDMTEPQMQAALDTPLWGHKPFDGSTGTPASGVAGHKSESQL